MNFNQAINFLVKWFLHSLLSDVDNFSTYTFLCFYLFYTECYFISQLLRQSVSYAFFSSFVWLSNYLFEDVFWGQMHVKSSFAAR